MAGSLDISTINIISPNGLVTKPLTVDNYGYAKLGDERVGVTPTNWIINGQFDVWQRGTSQTTAGYGSDDRWLNFHGVSTKTHSQQAFTIGQTVVPNNPTYFSRTIVISGGTASAFTTKQHRIEDVAKLAGKTVSLSFWAKADASKNLSIEFAQVFGTGGSSSVTGIGVQKFALTTSWQRFTKTFTLPGVNGKTIFSGNFTDFIFWFDACSDCNARTDSLGNQSGTFDIANVCLVEGSVPVECPNEPYAEVLRKCQRYYVRFGYNALTGAIYSPVICPSGYVYATTASANITNFPVSMRIKPSAIEYGGTIRIVDSANAYFAVTPTINNQTSEMIGVLTASSTGMTAGRFCQLYADGNAYVAFTAEL